jgi:hypothetical protein
MAKAYDTIQRSLLKSTLNNMGFPQTMINTIMGCVESVSFSILVNGKPTTYFKPHKGLRQGDPLSPYLFIICAEVLSGMILRKQQMGTIYGLTIARNAPAISHLFFADDSLLFCRAEKREAEEIMTIFNLYQLASGQKINLDKSEMVFSNNTNHHKKLEFYQGMPLSLFPKRFPDILVSPPILLAEAL